MELEEPENRPVLKPSPDKPSLDFKRGEKDLLKREVDETPVFKIENKQQRTKLLSITTPMIEGDEDSPLLESEREESPIAI